MRNLSINSYFRHLGSRHRPKYRFDGTSQQDWQQWREMLLPAVKATLGRLPDGVPPRPQVIAQWQEEGLVKQRLILDVEEGLAMTAYVFRPARLQGPAPAILACHGHGPRGKDAVMGALGKEAFAAAGAQNCVYGLEMAKAGYVVMAVDWRGFGDRDDRRKPNWNDMSFGQDYCNLHYLRATILGMTLLGMNIHDGMCAVDHLCSLEYVDPARIGVMGLSFGGTMALWMALCDERIKIANIICYSDRFADFGMRDINFCGSQITPGLYALADLPDLQGLLAPRGLLVEIGLFDDCFLLDSAMSCFQEVEKIYTAAGAREQLELDLFEGGHQWSGRKSVAFFNRHLR